MKYITFILSLLCTNLIMAQSIIPSTDSEHCPNIEYNYYVVLPYQYKSISSGKMIITQQPYNFNIDSTVFSFKAKFIDENETQYVNITYKNNLNHIFYFKKVKSLFYPRQNNQCPNINPAIKNHQAPLCKKNILSISFQPVKWQNNSEYPVLCFGSILSYEYKVPANWKVDSTLSTGNNWISGTNNTSITTDLYTLGNIEVRPKNTCAANLSNGSIPTIIYVNRPLAFTVSPANVTIDCGSNTPINYTANNPYNISGITNYTWNLGQTPNGWLYNGNPAPQFISTGLNNNIQITPICGSILSPVSVNVSANGYNCSSNSSSVSFTQPQISISGVESFCGSNSTYVLNNVPCNATINWSSSNPVIASISGSGNQATLTKVTNGDVTITATISGVNCLTNNTFSKIVSVGVPAANNIIMWSSVNSTNVGSPVGFVAGYPPNNRCQILSTEWQTSISSDIFSGNFPCEPDNETSKNIIFQNTGTAYVQAKILNTCGWSDWSAGSPIEVVSNFYFYSISPNPSNDYVIIKSKDKIKNNIKEVKIYDMFGNIKKKIKNEVKNSDVRINISELKDAVYIIEISDNDINERQQIIIKR